jgi:hypothetical protein
MPTQLEKTDAGSISSKGRSVRSRSRPSVGARPVGAAPHRSGPAATPPRPATARRSAVEPLGPDRGLGLLYWFVIATAVMVGAFVVAGTVGRMWILVPGMAVHLLMTFLVLSAIVRLLARGNDEH